MTERKFLLFGVSGILVALMAGGLALVLVLTHPKTPQAVTQEGEKNVRLQAEVVLDGLRHPWDIVELPNQEVLFSERSGEISIVRAGQKQQVHSIDDVQVNGEGGLMGLAADSDFTTNRYIYACYNSTAGDVRVARWELSEGAQELQNKLVIIEGIPANVSGRHSGCRIASAKDGVLWVGTGDAAQSSHPQDLTSLAGKVLRVSRDGQAIEGNSTVGDARIFSFGHRNIQGIMLFDQPVNGVHGYSIEHGPGKDDEINLLVAGNFGWDPLPPYNESVPMTDTQKYPNAVQAIWRSGETTIAPSGGTILVGSEWGSYEGAIAMAVLKNKQLRLITFDKDNNYQIVAEEPFFEREFGRIRSVVSGSEGIYLTTDNGSNDAIIFIRPEMSDN